MDNNPIDLELDSLLKEQALLAEKIAKIKADKLAYEMTKSVVVTVINFDIGIYTIRPNTERVNLDHKRWGRYASNDNTIRIAEENWIRYNQYLDEAKNVLVFIPPKVQVEIDKWISRPDAIVELADKQFIITLNTRLINGIQNYTISWGEFLHSKIRHSKQNQYTLPILEVEALALWIDWVRSGKAARNSFQEAKNVEVTKEAFDFMTTEVKRLKELDGLATAENVELDLDMNGFTLKPFQKVGVVFAEKSGNRCLIGDEMGLGKTIQALAIAKKNNLRVLIVSPPNLIENWTREIKSKVGDVPIRVFLGSTPGNSDITDLLFNKVQYNLIGYTSIGNYSFDTNSNGDEINKKFPWTDIINLSNFDMIVAEECHKIKNTDSGRSQGTVRINVKDKVAIGLSGTPVLNRPMELHPFFYWIAPDKVPKASDFAYRYTDGRNGARNVPELRNLLKSMMIRRLKSDVISELPAIINEYNYTNLTPRQTVVYNKILAGITEKLDKYGNVTGEQMHIMSAIAALVRLKQFCAAIKMQGVADYAIELYDEQGDDVEHKKAIIFSQFKSTARGIARRLGNEALYIDGEVPKGERMAIVDKFQSDPSIHFLVGTTAISEGLNITAAGHVIISDLLWTPADHQQFIGRAYGRLNDCHGVTVHWHIIKNTIEDWIMELLKEKMAMIEEVVDGVANERKTSSIAMEIIRRLRK